MALRASRRLNRATPKGGVNDFWESSISTTTSIPGAESGTVLNSTESAGAHKLAKGFRFDDIQEHFVARPSANLAVLETEAAIAAVLACGGCGVTEGGRVAHTVDRTSVSVDECGELAAEVLPSMCKVSYSLARQGLNTVKSRHPSCRRFLAWQQFWRVERVCTVGATICGTQFKTEVEIWVVSPA